MRNRNNAGQNGTEWFLPALEGKRAGFFCKNSPQKQMAATATNLRCGIFSSLDAPDLQRVLRKTPAETIATLERTVKDKDDRKPHDQSRGWGAPNTQNSGGWGAPQNDPNAVPDSRLQQAMRQQNQTPEFDDDIPF
jgi:hypothetical protein